MGNDGPDYSNVAAGGQVNVTHPLHVEQHEDGGEDELNVGGLGGELADEQLSAWAKVSDKPTTFTPGAHKPSHQNEGTDEINVAGLSGELADNQPPKGHKANHEDEGGDEINLGGLLGTPAELFTVSAIYNTGAGQSIPNAETTIVDFGTEVRDTHEAVTTGVAWKFTAPVSGVYLIGAVVLFVGTTTWEDGEIGQLSVVINGTTFIICKREDNYGSDANVYLQLDGITVVYLAVDDYVDIRLYQSSDAALALINDPAYNNVFIVRYVGS